MRFLFPTAAVAAVVLAVVAVATARAPKQPLPDLTGYFQRWAALHGGYDVSGGNRWLRGWLRMAYVLASPLARRGMQPWALTLWGALLAVGAVAAADRGGRWPLLAAALVVLSGLSDSLDGCVAVLTGRATRLGYVLDSAVDRISDLLHLLAVVAAGGAARPAVACGAGVFLLEYVRARGSNAGAGDLGTVTVAERATRVIVLAMALVGAGAVPREAGTVATGGLVLLGLLTAAGLAQLVVALRRLLADGSAPDAGRPGSGGSDQPSGDVRGQQHQR